MYYLKCNDAIVYESDNPSDLVLLIPPVYIDDGKYEIVNNTGELYKTKNQEYNHTNEEIPF